VCFFSRSSLEDEEFYAYPDQAVLSIMNELGVSPGGFNVARPSHLNYWPAMAKFDKLEVYNISSQVHDLALKYLDMSYARHIGKYGITPFEKVELNLSTRAGFPWNITKYEALLGHYAYFRSYCQPGVERPSPIWKVTGKTEYLAIAELLNHKLRLFKNPPLEFLLLEKCYFQEMEKALLEYRLDEWSALGFVKEAGGWHEFVEDLKVRGRWKFRWDVRFFDKSQFSRLLGVMWDIRRKFFREGVVVNERDWTFLRENSINAHEITFDGQVWYTHGGGKSGRLATSTDNTGIHKFMLFCLYIYWGLKSGRTLSYSDCMSVWRPRVYSDDIQGATDEVSLVCEEHVTEVFERFGMGVQEYCCSEDVESIHFLGAGNKLWPRYGTVWNVPCYSEERMLYAVGYLGGRVTPKLRSERLTGLIHNLCFCERAELLDVVVGRLVERGLWDPRTPVPSVEGARLSYVSFERSSRASNRDVRNIGCVGAASSIETAMSDPLLKLGTSDGRKCVYGFSFRVYYEDENKNEREIELVPHRSGEGWELEVASNRNLKFIVQSNLAKVAGKVSNVYGTYIASDSVYRRQRGDIVINTLFSLTGYHVLSDPGFVGGTFRFGLDQEWDLVAAVLDAAHQAHHLWEVDSIEGTILQGKKARAPAAAPGMSKSARRRRRQKALLAECEAVVAATPVAPRSRGLRNNDKKWFFGLKDVSAGPVKIGSLGAGSGDERSIRSRGNTVGVAPRSVNVQRRMPTLSSGQGGPYGSMDILRGTEFLASINTPLSPPTNKGDLLKTILINPTSFVDTRLKQFAPLYQRYRFKRLTFIYEPTAPATAAGQLIGYGDYDVDNLLTVDDPSNINQAAAHAGQAICQVWELQSFPFGIRDDYTTLFTSLTGAAENRLVYQGVYYLLAATDLPPSLACGNIYVDYEVEFYIPQLGSSAIATSWSYEATGEASTNKNNPMGAHVTPAPVIGVNNLAVTYSTSISDSIFAIPQIPSGPYVVVYSATGSTGGAGTGISWVTGITGAVKEEEGSSVVVPAMADTGAALTTYSGYLLLTVNGPLAIGLQLNTATVTDTAIIASSTFRIYSVQDLSPSLSKARSKNALPLFSHNGRFYKSEEDFESTERELRRAKEEIRTAVMSELLENWGQPRLEPPPAAAGIPGGAKNLSLTTAVVDPPPILERKPKRRATKVVVLDSDDSASEI